jgi:deoxycytidylate deaminase
METLQNSNELIIGIAGPIGVDMEMITECISNGLHNLEYKTQVIKLTSEIHKFGDPKKVPDQKDMYTVYNGKMDHANEVRKFYKRPDTLARIAVQAIREYRMANTKNANKPEPSKAYIIRQLKLPQEVQLLRKIYGRQFILVSAYASESDRFSLLSKQIRRHLPTDTSETDIGHKAADLIARDAKEDGDNLGQNLRDTFHLADVFTHGTDRKSAEESIERFFQALFGRNDITPSKDEYGMYAAKSAALRSADLSRQVGAVIYSKDGEVITQGCNDVAKPHGGNYWDNDVPDLRDIQLGSDPNDELKRAVLRNVIERLFNAGFLSDKAKQIGNSFDITEKLTDKKDEKLGVLSDSKVMDLTEYGRVVHAEMNAICDAARLGKPIKAATLYCTTFPCHNCTKHIVATGIDRVVFLEPYPKSKAPELFQHEIEIESENDLNKVSFVPFLGISPFRYRDIFQKEKRKKNDGIAKKWYFDKPRPMIDVDFPSYINSELFAIMPLLGDVTDNIS